MATIDRSPQARKQRAYVYNGGFLTQKTIRRILDLSGYDLCLGLPRRDTDDCVAIWGNAPTAHRGTSIAHHRDAPLVYVEDAFIRSLFPARLRPSAPRGLLIDTNANHFDASRPSDLERILTDDPLDHGGDLQRARDAMTRIQSGRISKYSAYRDDPMPQGGFVLVIDQTRNDAAVRASKGDDALFAEMLYYAQEHHPGQRIVIKTHPETRAGKRAGYYTHDHCTTDKISLYTGDASPWDLLENAIAVYTVSSTMGFEAIIAGHRPYVFGSPFYAGWGLTEDMFPFQRRQRRLTRAQLFLAAMIRYPKWYDLYTDRLCDLETILDQAEAELRAYRADHQGWNAHHIRLWKRSHFRKIFGQYGPVHFGTADAERPHMVWANRAHEAQPSATRVEDGFIRSRGLGAELIPPLSLVTDQRGIYYDPRYPSDLEHLLAQSAPLRRDQKNRIDRVITQIISQNLTKYNLAGDTPPLPDGYKILVPGQVEDDASIKTGTDQITTNLALLTRVRQDNPDAVIIYKPHPDVVAGLRTGAIPDDIALGLADIVTHSAPISTVLAQVDHVHTMTSLTGFEALLRRIPVTTYGMPFYAGWGLTTDHAPIPNRRGRTLDLDTLAHRALIDYPRYFDPLTQTICPIEVILERLVTDTVPKPGRFNRTLSKLQGLFASASPFWR